MKIQKIESTRRNKVKRVAAYARVSTLLESQEDSFDTQMKYYDALIKGTQNWKFTKVYADHGFSGVSAKKRPGFMEMIADAENRKFDILLVRSISRFARNVVEAREYCRKLKLLGIEVQFEKERISSMDKSAELAFNLLAACAQEESRAISERIQWSYKEHAKLGIRHLGNNRILGYDEIDTKLTPNEDAWIVKLAFERYAEGKTLKAIAQELSDLGVVGIRNGKPILPERIWSLLRNEIYIGDRRLQKAPHNNYMTHKPDWSQPYDSYYIRNAHEGIVSRELWDRVQERIEANACTRHRESHFLYGKIYCGKCGQQMKRKLVAGIGGEKIAVWKCNDRLKGRNGNGCKNDIVKEVELIRQICEQMGCAEEEIATRLDCVERIVVSGQRVDVLFYAVE